MENSILANNIYESAVIAYDENSGGFNIDTGSMNSLGDTNKWDNNPMTIDNYYHNYWYPYVQPTVTLIPEKSKIEVAFQILNKLMKKGVATVNKVKTFVDLVTEIADCI